LPAPQKSVIPFMIHLPEHWLEVGDYLREKIKTNTTIAEKLAYLCSLARLQLHCFPAKIYKKRNANHNTEMTQKAEACLQRRVPAHRLQIKFRSGIRLEAAITLARAPKARTTRGGVGAPPPPPLFEPGLFFCSVISVCCMFLTLPHSCVQGFIMDNTSSCLTCPMAQLARASRQARL